MQVSIKALIIILLVLGNSCTGDHLISDKNYRALVEKSFNERDELFSQREKDLLHVFSLNLTKPQSEALKFLYAFMPLSDLAEYNGEFFLANIDIALRAKAETPWGDEIPEDIFLHYVLPCRVNNENLDSFRIIYYDEIMSRVIDLDLQKAALEINHWCHEKVSYQPADSRTSAPMSTVLSARGRCGEESTFTVAALRTAGIPARQVYTPRWAHSDDNHAWVEIWINGKWYYMGACEPEPETDRGWFTEPARRAMLIHTKSFGAPHGNENSIVRFRNYDLVNNLSKYASTKQLYVKVIDKDGVPVENADVEYQLYNYAEFYPIASVPTDQNGISRFETGLGDLLVWAHKGNDFIFKKISVSETDTLELNLSFKSNNSGSMDLDLDVPIKRKPFDALPEELVEMNSKRIDAENIIRQNYINSWIKPEEISALAEKLKIDHSAAATIFSKSMGNYSEIRSFLLNAPDSLKQTAVSLLSILPDKDLRDTRGYILADHLTCTPDPVSSGVTDIAFYLSYIMNPRIANEIIVPWRSYFINSLPPGLIDNGSRDPGLIVKYINENIVINEEDNYYKTPLTPKGVNELKVSDSESRNICFVAICRTLGIPARLEPGSNVPQYFQNNEWCDVYFSDQEIPSLRKGYLKLVSSDTKPVPEYFTHFTIARLVKGRYNTLEYENKKITEFKDEIPLIPGDYMIVTGNRINDSRILANISFFNLAENEHRTFEIKIRKDLSEKKIIGKINLAEIAALYYKSEDLTEKLADKGTVIIWLEPEKEPSKHILNDLPFLKSEFEDWGGFFLFLTDDRQDADSSGYENLPHLPEKSMFGVDEGIVALKNITLTTKASDSALPFIIVTDKEGNITFSSSGYRIGIGEQILKHLN